MSETETIFIEGLEDEGPGDIVGAIASKTSVSGNHIGNIQLNSPTRVEIPRKYTEEVVKVMDDNRIGQSEVEVWTDQAEKKTSSSEIDQYSEHWSTLVELERQQEMEEHEQEIRNLSGREREEEGRAILHLRGRDEGEGLSGFLVKFMRNRKGEQLPENEISVGDLVMISKKDPLRDDNPTGTVTEKTNYSITVSFGEKPGGFVYGKNLRMDLYVNDITYQRMLDALKQLNALEDEQKQIRDVITGIEQPASVEPRSINSWKNPQLNQSQKEAVRKATGSGECFLVHGPPGTGKTTTVIEAIQQHVEEGKSILATADSNMAVDNLVEFLVKQGVYVVRVGHPARVTPAIKEHTLDHMIQNHDLYQKSRDLRDQAFQIKDQQDDLTHPSGRWRRGLSNQRIQQLADEGRSTRGIPQKKIDEMAQWLNLQDRADELFERSDQLEEQAIDETLNSASVVCSTNSTAGSDLLEDRTFDVVVIDEATQATETSCLIPITKGRKVIMAGDHRQLPPTIKNQEAARNGMRRTLFEKLADWHGNQIKHLLNIQYRMNEVIMEFASKEFYDAELQADASVRHHTLNDDLKGTCSEDETIQQILDPEAPLVYVNTREVDASERTRAGSTSKENVKEAELISRLVQQVLSENLDPAEIAVIAPYDDQVDLLQDHLDLEDLEIKTVDGFQGREKDVVFISMTRSNVRGNIGFLKEKRRFNVALTRARRKAVAVGDESTLQSDDTYKSFIKYARKQGREVRL